MLRLMSEYFKNNPQVWKASWIPPDAARPDVEGYTLRRITGTDVSRSVGRAKTGDVCDRSSS